MPDSRPLVANARMYGATPDAAAAWAALFRWAAERSGVALDLLPHPAPAPMAALWGRADLGAAFMCGRPWTRAEPTPVPVAAPVPSPARYAGLPRYCTDIAVRADSGFASLEDTFGGRIGYTIEESHSGFNALRHHLLRYRTAARPRLYRDSVGPLLTPRGVVDALLDGRIEAGPIDGYSLDLMLRDPRRPGPPVAGRRLDRLRPDPLPGGFARRAGGSGRAPAAGVAGGGRGAGAGGRPGAPAARRLRARGARRLCRADRLGPRGHRGGIRRAGLSRAEVSGS